MKKIAVSPFLILISSSFLFGQIETIHIDEIIDGDTFRATDSKNNEYKLRLANVDCPEKGQPGYQYSINVLCDLIYDKYVLAELINKDRYGRIIGKICLNNEIDLSYYLVEQGFAWHYQRYSDDESLNDAEEHARDLQKGIWGDSTAIAPWIWRKNKRLKIN